VLDLNWRPPKSGDLWVKSKAIEKGDLLSFRVWSHSGNSGPPPPAFNVRANHIFQSPWFLPQVTGFWRAPVQIKHLEEWI
jgi:hypothetical protein